MPAVGDYEIVLTAGAREAIREMPDEEQERVAGALRTELLDAHGIRHPYREIPTGSPRTHVARSLTTGHVAVCRLMCQDELRALARQRRRSVARRGVVVHDVLRADNAPPPRGNLLDALASPV